MVAYTQRLSVGLVLSLSCFTYTYGQSPVTNITATTTEDGNLGTVITPVGNGQQITGGTRPGDGTNLFHSFENFSIGPGEFANFLNENSNGPVTDNILSRVTGGTSSEIYGTIKTTGFPGANLYLMNPAGVIFGPSAKLEVEGSFHATTADYLRFEDGTRFNAISIPPDEVLSVAPVAAFGFLEANPEQLFIEGSQLSVPEGGTLSMVSGDMDIGEGASLATTEGQVNLVSAGSMSEVILGDSSVEISPVETLGHISLSEASIKGGRIVVRGEDLIMVGGEIRASSRATAPDSVNGGEPGPSSTILIKTEKSVTIDGDSDVVSGGIGATMGAGSIHIESKATDVSVRESFVSGDSVTILATQGKATIDDAVASTDIVGLARPAGQVTVQAKDVLVTGDRSRIGGSAKTTSGGAAASVTILGASEKGTVELTGDSTIHADSFDPSGPAGDITISAEQVTISGTAGSLHSGPDITADSQNGGPAGSIYIAGTRVSIMDESRVTSVTTGSQPAGSVTIMAPLENGTVLITGHVNIVTKTAGTGAGGELTISGGDVRITGKETHSPLITAATAGLGPGGDVSIRAGNSITITGNATIRSSNQMLNMDSDIGAGNIVITTPILFMAGGNLEAETRRSGPAGDIVLNVGKFEASSGATLTSNSWGARSSATAGNITIRGFNGETDPFDQPLLVTLIDSAIRTEAAGGGAAGNVSIVGSNIMLVNAEVSAVAKGTGRGGHIALEATGAMMKLTEANISVEVKDVPTGSNPFDRVNPFSAPAADSGFIPGLDIVPAPDIGLPGVTLKAPALEIVGGRVNAQTSGRRDGGAITLEAATVELRDAELTSSSISTAPRGGQPGSITILNTGSGPSDQVTVTDSAVLTQIQGAQGGRRPSEAAEFGQIQIIPNPVDVGQIQIVADTLNLDGSRISGTTAGRGDASMVRLWANEIELQGSEISSSTSAIGDTPGNAGQIFIGGAQGESSIANRLALLASEISTGTTGDGLGGEIQIDALEVSLSEDSEISASTASVGSAGGIGVRVGNLSSQDSLISSVSTSTAPDAGAAGSIGLTATDTVSIDKGGLTTVANGGAGGSIDVSATNVISLAATEVLATVLGGEQAGGDVTLSAPQIRLTNGTAIAAESEGAGTAGAIAVGDAGTASLRLQNSTVSTNAAEAKGGDINVQAQEIVHLTDSAITTSVGAGEGQGGNIFIDPQYVILNASRVQANAVGGPGGRIEIISDIFIASADSVVEAVSETNIQGVILISAPERDVVSGASVLPAEFQDPSRRLRASCGQRVDVGRSNFREVGLEGLPPSPDDYLWVTPLLPVAEAGGGLQSVVFFEPATTQFLVTPCGQN